MAQDIRELLKQDKTLPSENVPKGHEARFLERLEQELPITLTNVTKKRSYKWLQIAASIAIILSVSLAAYFTSDKQSDTDEIIVNVEDVEKKASEIDQIKKLSNLAAISPDFKKIEEYYTNSIKMELTSLDVNDTNKELIDSFMKQLEQLDLEYEKLNTELLEVGANEQTVQALIENLQLRLELMLKLKERLKKLKKISDETYQDQQA